MAGAERSVQDLVDAGGFQRRHIGPSDDDQAQMLRALGLSSTDDLLDVAVPAWSTAAPRPERTYAQEPLSDPELEPPRGLLQVAGGVAFVLLLLAIAWYLATSL